MKPRVVPECDAHDGGVLGYGGDRTSTVGSVRACEDAVKAAE